MRSAVILMVKIAIRVVVIIYLCQFGHSNIMAKHRLGMTIPGQGHAGA
jgi:hypothetical protein